MQGLLEALEEILRTPKLKKKASMKGAEDEKDTFGRDCYGSAPSAAVSKPVYVCPLQIGLVECIAAREGEMLSLQQWKTD